MQSKENAAAVKYADDFIPSFPGFKHIDLIRAFEAGSKWQSELPKSETVYTEKDMIDFAADCGNKFHYINGTWRDDPDPKQWTTEDLLSLYLKTRIPTKIV